MISDNFIPLTNEYKSMNVSKYRTSFNVLLGFD